MKISGKNRPLLLAQRRKLLVGSFLLALFALLALFPGAASGPLGVSAWVLESGAVSGFAVLLYWLARGLKCPKCGVNLLWHVFGHAKYGNWLEWMLGLSACPKCGYRETPSAGSKGST